MTDCDHCMATLSRDTRIEIGCGYEPRSPLACPRPPDGFNAGVATSEHPRGPRAPTVCVGYTTNLPEVIETVHAYRHWKERTLIDRCGPPTEALWLGLETLGSEVAACESWCIRNPRKAAS